MNSGWQTAMMQALSWARMDGDRARYKVHGIRHFRGGWHYLVVRTQR